MSRVVIFLTSITLFLSQEIEIKLSGNIDILLGAGKLKSDNIQINTSDEKYYPALNDFYDSPLGFSSTISYLTSKSNKYNFMIGLSYSVSNLHSSEITTKNILGPDISIKQFSPFIGFQSFWGENKRSFYKFLLGPNFISAQGDGLIEASVFAQTEVDAVYNYKNTLGFRIGVGMGQKINNFSIGLNCNLNLGSVKRSTVDIYSNNTLLYKYEALGDTDIVYNSIELNFEIAYAIGFY